MPLQTYPIYGKVYDNNGDTISGVTLYLIDTTTREQLDSEYYATSASDGEYELNMAHLDTYTDGDTFEVVAEAYGKYAETRKTGTVTIANGGSEVNIFMEFSDMDYKGVTVRDVVRLDGINSKYKKSFMVWSNNFLASGSAQVVTTGGGRGKGVTTSTIPIVNLSTPQVCYVRQLTAMIRTASKTCTFAIVKCSSADGAGTATAVTGQIYEANGTLVEAKPFTIKFANPIRIEYNSTNALSVGVQINASDSSTYVDIIMEGEVLEE